MTYFEIGLKVNTLPVVALGVGVGVDYGIYIYTRFQHYLKRGESIRASYWHALRVTGAAVVFTGVTLGVGVFTWVFSPLQLQADMGVLLTFMFFVNMLGAILLLPAIAAFILKEKPGATETPQIEH
jgi:predicted RND superfamily exporter protein